MPYGKNKRLPGPDIFFEESFRQICESRRKYPDNADIWELRWKWKDEYNRFSREFAGGRFRFGVRTWISLPGNRDAEITGARDAVAEKVLSGVLWMALAPALSGRCFHLNGNGGMKAALREAIGEMKAHSFVFRTDVKSFYESVDHGILWEKVRKHVYAARHSLPVHPNIIMNYTGQWLNRVVEKNGIYEEKFRGIPAASSLSPLMGGFYLADLDRKAEKLPVFYARYMDDILFLTKTRNHLTKGIRTVKREFESLNLAAHPEKTFAGRKEKGFDFLGYHFDSDGNVSVSEKTFANFLHKVKEMEKKSLPGKRNQRVEEYTLRWIRWAKAGLSGI